MSNMDDKDDNEKSVMFREEEIEIDDRDCYSNGEEDDYENCSEGSNSNSFVDNVYFQSFILGVAFMAMWSPQSLMAPNLTAMADTFNFSNAERDRLLGADISMATSVFSLPLSALIGFLADFVSSRRNLYALTIMVGGSACWWSGRATSFEGLLFSRFVTGGCMSGCTPVAFSLLGDLFETRERNMASSALTAMMGVGIILGNVIAGMLGPWTGWRTPFDVSAVFCMISALLCLLLVDEPIRGGKEEVLQDMIKQGKAYDRKLTWNGFFYAMLKNSSNVIILMQGFFGSVPFGIIFIYLNDYLSQEQGLSVRSATFLVCVYGVGCAVGGILGGYLGGYFAQQKETYLPIFMGTTTIIGVIPYLGMLDITLKGHRSNFIPIALAFFAGMIESLPSVNIRPCLISVNPPEVRGAALTTANLIINLARGVGPVFMTKICAHFDVLRKASMNFILIFFWIIAGIQLFLLAFTLPQDKDRMEKELTRYANSLTAKSKHPKQIDEETPLIHTTCTTTDYVDADPVSPSSINRHDHQDEDLDITVISIEERQIAFDADAFRDSLKFMSGAFQDMNLINSPKQTRRRKLDKPKTRRAMSYNHDRKFKYKIINQSSNNMRRQTSLPIKDIISPHQSSNNNCPQTSFPIEDVSPLPLKPTSKNHIGSA